MKNVNIVAHKLCVRTERPLSRLHGFGVQLDVQGSPGVDAELGPLLWCGGRELWTLVSGHQFDQKLDKTENNISLSLHVMELCFLTSCAVQGEGFGTTNASALSLYG